MVLLTGYIMSVVHTYGSVLAFGTKSDLVWQYCIRMRVVVLL